MPKDVPRHKNRHWQSMTTLRPLADCTAQQNLAVKTYRTWSVEDWKHVIWSYESRFRLYRRW